MNVLTKLMRSAVFGCRQTRLGWIDHPTRCIQSMCLTTGFSLPKTGEVKRINDERQKQKTAKAPRCSQIPSVSRSSLASLSSLLLTTKDFKHQGCSEAAVLLLLLILFMMLPSSSLIAFFVFYTTGRLSQTWYSFSPRSLPVLQTGSFQCVAGLVNRPFFWRRLFIFLLFSVFQCRQYLWMQSRLLFFCTLQSHFLSETTRGVGYIRHRIRFKEHQLPLFTYATPSE